MENVYPKAYKEVCEILKYMPKESVEKIPLEMRLLFERKLDIEYDFEIDEDKPFEEQQLLLETKAILANLYRDYWASKNIELADDGTRMTINGKNVLNKTNYNIWDMRGNEPTNSFVYIANDKFDWNSMGMPRSWAGGYGNVDLFAKAEQNKSVLVFTYDYVSQHKDQWVYSYSAKNDYGLLSESMTSMTIDYDPTQSEIDSPQRHIDACKSWKEYYDSDYCSDVREQGYEVTLNY